jgi:hypothetical protein
MPDIKEYSSAMSIDPTTGKIMPKYELAKRTAKTIKTHNNKSIPLSGNLSNDNWEDADGFIDLAVTVLNDANTQFAVTVLWSNDKVTTQGAEVLLSGATGVWSNSRAGQTPVKARYFKIIILNNDAAAAHVFNAWAYLKA